MNNQKLQERMEDYARRTKEEQEAIDEIIEILLAVQKVFVLKIANELVHCQLISGVSFSPARFDFDMNLSKYGESIEGYTIGNRKAAFFIEIPPNQLDALLWTDKAPNLIKRFREALCLTSSQT